MNRASVRSRDVWTSVPHASGDEPAQFDAIDKGIVLFPTRVGMNRRRRRPRFDAWAVPHASGDEPDPIADPDKTGYCSPREWG